MKIQCLFILFAILLVSCENKKTTKYPSGKVKEEVELNEKGLKQGKKISYFENGKIQSEALYQNDTLNGSYIDYYENGNKRIECNYKKGAIEGNYKDYYFTGKINSIINYKKGLYDGGSLYLYTDGSTKTEAIFKNGIYLYYIKYDSLGNVSDKDFFIQIDILNKLTKHDSVKVKAKIYHFINKENKPIHAVFYKLPLTSGASGEYMLFNKQDSCYYYTFKPANETGKFNIGVRILLENKFPIRADSVITIGE